MCLQYGIQQPSQQHPDSIADHSTEAEQPAATTQDDERLKNLEALNARLQKQIKGLQKHVEDLKQEVHIAASKVRGCCASLAMPS